MTVRLPTSDKRTCIIGSTGTGKTQAGVWHLSTKDFDRRPWVIIDYKRDDLIARTGAIEIPVGSKPPNRAGLYVMRPTPVIHDDIIEAFFWNCLTQEYIGIYIDEGFMVGTKDRNKGLTACLTQGRSKLIEIIILTQRPVLLNRFAFSESDFFQVFRLNDFRDRETVQSMISVSIKKKLPPYYSFWYDVGNDLMTIFSPVPDSKTILESFKKRVKTGMKKI